MFSEGRISTGKKGGKLRKSKSKPPGPLAQIASDGEVLN